MGDRCTEFQVAALVSQREFLYLASLTLRPNDDSADNSFLFELLKRTPAGAVAFLMRSPS
jgi:hypothetical protein